MDKPCLKCTKTIWHAGRGVSACDLCKEYDDWKELCPRCDTKMIKNSCYYCPKCGHKECSL